MPANLTFRFDDIGASSKLYVQYGKKVLRYKSIPFFYFPLANFWFFKRIWPFAKGGPYQELSVPEWQEILEIFKKENIHPIIAITAAWVEEDGSLTPFPQKFPKEAALLKQAFQEGVIRIANHGLTHCVVGRHLPRLFSSNRSSHREFWPSLEEAIHQEHIKESQAILENYFQAPISILVPPGNIWSKKTALAMEGTHLDTVIADKYMLDSDEPLENISFIHDNEGYQVFHDKDLKRGGPQWLQETIQHYKKGFQLT